MPERDRTLGSVNPAESKHADIISASLFSYRSEPWKLLSLKSQA